MSHRYLLHISYIGTQFRGLQKNFDTRNKEITSSVQSSIEWAIRRLQPINEPKLTLSSRTDAGVHALSSNVHIDLERPSGEPYCTSKITYMLNKFFMRENLQIRINKIEIVPPTFHARYCAKRRTYLYRFAIPKFERPVGEIVSPYVPIDEFHRCYFVRFAAFDLNLAYKAAELIQGKHDFRTFMGSAQQDSEKDHAFFALRVIDSIKISEGASICNVFTKPLADENYNFYDLRVSGRSFLNRQVRRIVAVILAVAQERITLRDVYEMLTIPSKHTWSSRVDVAPPYGLYLCGVEYDDKDKEFPVDELPKNELPK